MTAKVVIVTAIHVFFSGFSFRKIKLIMAAIMGAKLSITKVFATFVISIEITKQILAKAAIYQKQSKDKNYKPYRMSSSENDRE